MKRKLISILLCLCILATLVPAATVFAQTELAADSVPQSKLTGSDSFGTLFTKAVAQEQTAQTDGSSLQSISFQGNTATVALEVPIDAVLLVAVYDEQSKALLATGKAKVAAGTETATVDMETQTMPAYFIAQAFLLNPDEYTPLCDTLTTPMYTRQMQELLKRTTDDFESERVLKLSDDTNTNFAVYNEKVKISRSDGTTNHLTSADGEALRYELENPDAAALQLQAGDIWACENADGTVLIVKVTSAEQQDGRLLLTGAETSMEEVLDYAKIETTAQTENAIVDTSVPTDGVTYNGLTAAQPETSDTRTPPELPPLQQLSFGIHKQFGEDSSVEFTGSIALIVAVELKYYLAQSEVYIDFSQSITSELAGSLTGRLKRSKVAWYGFGELAWCPVSLQQAGQGDTDFPEGSRILYDDNGIRISLLRREESYFGSSYTIPKDADRGLIDIGLDENFQVVTDPIYN